RGLVSVGGIVEYTLEREVTQVPSDRSDRLILWTGLFRGEGGNERVNLVARELAVEHLPRLGQRLPHSLGGARRLIVEQARPGGDAPLLQGDGDVSAHGSSPFGRR